MKADDRVFSAQNIGNYQGRFEMFIKGLKKDSFEVFGYARKSPHNLHFKKKNLQNMIDCLRHRLLSLISSQDMSNTDEELTQMELDHCAVCLIIVDYAGLSTVPADFQALVGFDCRKGLPHRSI
ncbi:hypothetical protein CLU79DRAFT_804958 [Phycomyces nitens]|nr:hypothetical protein CLU79DRAFT_804958 [Phycomyces nitens]